MKIFDLSKNDIYKYEYQFTKFPELKVLDLSSNSIPSCLSLDYIFEKAALELNFKERKNLYDKYQKIVYTQKPIIYLYSPLRISAIRTKFKNIYPTSLGGLLHNREEIYIEEK